MDVEPLGSRPGLAAPTIALAAVKHGKHVLVEKPAGISVAEIEALEASLAATAADAAEDDLPDLGLIVD